MNKCLCLLASFGFATASLALPEDANEEISIIGGQSEMDLNLGLVTMSGTEEKPVVVTQGSLKVTGLKVIVERLEDGDIRKVTIKGKPARFQQQPAIDQEIVYASGHEIAFNNSEQLITIDIEAELIQDGNILTGCHIDYRLTTKKANAKPCDENGQLEVVIPPSPDQ